MLRKQRSLKVIPKLISLLPKASEYVTRYTLRVGGEFVDLLQSKSLSIANIFNNTYYYPLSKYSREIYIGSSVLQKMYLDIRDYQLSTTSISRRSYPGQAYLLAPIAFSAQEVYTFYLAMFAIEQFFDPDNAIENGTGPILAATLKRIITVGAVLPSASSTDRSFATKRFYYKPKDLVADKKLTPIDLLFLPARYVVSGLNLVECSRLYNLDIIPKLATQR